MVREERVRHLVVRYHELHGMSVILSTGRDAGHLRSAVVLHATYSELHCSDVFQNCNGCILRLAVAQLRHTIGKLRSMALRLRMKI